jgi:hypothetical protein
LGLIRNAKIRLEEKGVTPSIDVSTLFYLVQNNSNLVSRNIYPEIQVSIM